MLHPNQQVQSRDFLQETEKLHPRFLPLKKYRLNKPYIRRFSGHPLHCLKSTADGQHSFLHVQRSIHAPHHFCGTFPHRCKVRQQESCQNGFQAFCKVHRDGSLIQLRLKFPFVQYSIKEYSLCFLQFHCSTKVLFR